MISLLDAERRAAQTEFRAFAERELAPNAAAIDLDQTYPEALVETIAAAGLLAPYLPAEGGGSAMDPITYGLLTAEIGRACSATRSLLTAHGMTAYALSRFASRPLRESLLPDLAAGRRIAAIAMTEPNIGSDASHPELTATPRAGGYALRGQKCWITFGQRADLFLVLAACEGKPVAFLVDRDTDGLSLQPVSGMFGTRGAMLADLAFEDCFVPSDRMIGKPGFGFSLVIASALDLGRYSVAWGCVGLIRACLEACLSHTGSRAQFGRKLKEHQLVRQKITQMATALRTAELLCLNAGALRSDGAKDAVRETMIAKYHASTEAKRAADDAMQLLGARGLSDRHPVERYYRDAKVCEVIEGSTQILESVIAEMVHADHDRNPSKFTIKEAAE